MDSSNKDAGSSYQRQCVPDVKLTGAVGAGAGSGLGSDPAGISQPLFKKKFNIYRGLFPAAKSCADLEQMGHLSAESTPSGSITNIPAVTEASRLGSAAPPSAPATVPRYGGMFRNHRSCANLQQFGTVQTPQAQPTDEGAAQVDRQSGLLFGSLKSYFATSNMVSARDMNVMAPLSS